jgi:hypothetical protein
MSLKKIVSLIILISVSAAVHAEKQRCGLILPNDTNSILKMNKRCEISIVPNYANLSYFTLVNNEGVDSLLLDDTFFAKFNGKNYFVSEEINDPRVTVTVVNQEEATPIHTSEIHGYRGRSILFVQMLSKSRTSEPPFSGKVSCLTVAEGNEQTSFKTRFCSPLNSNGKKQMTRFESVLNKIAISGTKP